MSDATVRFAGAELIATVSGALAWPEAEALIVADLHLEKASSFARRGAFLPPYDTSATLARLAIVLDRFRPRVVICLGDSFHDRAGAQRLSADDRVRLRALSAGRDWIWVAGNHDPDVPDLPSGRSVAETSIGCLIFRHQARAATKSGEVSGHLHPKASLSVAGRKLTGRCFVADEDRLILPAFGTYTGGLQVNDPAFDELLRPPYTIYLVGRTKVHILPQTQ